VSAFKTHRPDRHPKQALQLRGGRTNVGDEGVLTTSTRLSIRQRRPGTGTTSPRAPQNPPPNADHGRPVGTTGYGHAPSSKSRRVSDYSNRQRQSTSSGFEGVRRQNRDGITGNVKADGSPRHAGWSSGLRSGWPRLLRRVHCCSRDNEYDLCHSLFKVAGCRQPARTVRYRCASIQSRSLPGGQSDRDDVRERVAPDCPTVAYYSVQHVPHSNSHAGLTVSRSATEAARPELPSRVL
jgi:hypothetical protein